MFLWAHGRKKERADSAMSWLGFKICFSSLAECILCFCLCDTSLISLCGKTTADLVAPSEQRAIFSRLAPCSGHCSISQDETQPSAFICPDITLGCDFTCNCTEMQWLQWVVFCWSTCWQNHDKNKQLVPVKSRGQTQSAYFLHKWFNVTGHGERRRSVRKNKQERKYCFRITHPK